MFCQPKILLFQTQREMFLVSLIFFLYIIIISTHLKTAFCFEISRSSWNILETFIDREWLKHTCFSTKGKLLSTCCMIIFIFIIYCDDHYKTHYWYCMDKLKFPAKTFVSQRFLFFFFFFRRIRRALRWLVSTADATDRAQFVQFP